MQNKREHFRKNSMIYLIKFFHFHYLFEKDKEKGFLRVKMLSKLKHFWKYSWIFYIVFIISKLVIFGVSFQYLFNFSLLISLSIVIPIKLNIWFHLLQKSRARICLRLHLFQLIYKRLSTICCHYHHRKTTNNFCFDERRN